MQLENELICLKNVEWFLTKFMALAKDSGIEFSLSIFFKICKFHFIAYHLNSDIVISEGFLICEIGEPSHASSLPPFEENAAVWLMEPHHTKAVQKFSGTLVHLSCTDKLGQTLSAFAHFVYKCSGKELVLADIQGHLMQKLFLLDADLSFQDPQ